MSVSYNGKKIIPAPLVNINKTYQKAGDGSKVGVLYSISLNGTLLPWRGSPSGNYSDINNAFWSLGGSPPDETVDATDGAPFDRLLRKQEALRDLFSVDGKSLEWQPAGGQPVVKCNPRVLDITFPEDNWADRAEYTIGFEADWIRFTNAPSGEDFDDLDTLLIQSAAESWSFEEIEGFEGTAFRVLHNVRAKGIIGYDENGIALGTAWEHARDWVDTRASGTIDSIIMSGAIGSAGFIGGSFVKNTTVDEKTGDYTVAESWVSSSGSTYTEKQFACNKALLADEFTATYNGTIFGIKANEGKGGSQAIDNAKAAVPTDDAARTETTNQLGSFLGSNVLGTAPSQKNIGINNQNGTVTFSFEWGVDVDATFSRVCEASLDLVKETNIHTLRLSCNIEGIGKDSATRLANSQAAILSDAEALSLAKSLVGGSLPVGVNIVDTPVGTGSSYNEKTGAVTASYSWTSTNVSDPQISVQTSYPSDVSAKLTIPGRDEGPIIQDMETQTEKVITVSLSSENNKTQPDNASTIALMDAFVLGSFLLDKDDDTFNTQSGRYSRTRVYTLE